jgi:hypothetical protein
LERQQIRQLFGAEAGRARDRVLRNPALSPSRAWIVSRNLIVLIDREFPEFTANFVGIDDITAGRIATEHFVGYRLPLRSAHQQRADGLHIQLPAKPVGDIAYAFRIYLRQCCAAERQSKMSSPNQSIYVRL